MKYTISAFAFGLFLSVGAHASTIISVQPATVAAGGSGAFDISLTNTGPSAIMVGAFTFGISITNPAISFTAANTATVLDSYIFAGHSLFGPDLTGPTSGQSSLVSDVFATPGSGATVASGTTVGLGHVLFTVASNSAPGAFTSSLVSNPATSLADPSGNNIAIDTLTNGTVTVSSAPEPSSLLLLIAGLPLLRLRKRHQRKPPTTPSGGNYRAPMQRVPGTGRQISL